MIEDIDFPTEMQKRVFAAVSSGVDVHIEDLFMKAYPGKPIERVIGTRVESIYEVRELQQMLGPLLHRMNGRLAKHKLKIMPGKLKQTYCLSNIVG